MWIIVRDSDHVVVGTNYTREPIVSIGHTVKEWTGVEPEIDSIDPTLADPDYADFVQSGVDFRALYAQAGTEVAWLDTNIPLVSVADLTTLRMYLERVMRQNRQTIKAWRYLARKLQ